MRLRLLPALAGLSLLVSACGGSAAPASSSAAATAARPSTAAPASAAAKPATSAGASAAGGLQTVTMAQSVPTLSFAPLYIARDQGYFQKQGVKLEFTQLQSGTTAFQALLGGSVNFVASASTNTAAAYAQGQPVLAIQGMVNMTEQVCASKKFMEGKSVTPTAPLDQRMSAFKGATIGIAGPGDATDRPMRWLLSKYGKLNPDTDTTIVNVGGATAMTGAIEANKIQGFLLSPPGCNEAAKAGAAEVLVKPNEVPEFKNYIHEVLITTKDWASGHKELATKTATAVSMGNNYLLQHPQESIALLEKGDFSKIDPAIVESAINDIVLPQVPKDGRMSQDSWKNTNTVLVEAGILKQPVDVKEGGMWTNAYLGNATVQ